MRACIVLMIAFVVSALAFAWCWMSERIGNRHASHADTERKK